jgi:hypothetical protein
VESKCSWCGESIEPDDGWRAYEPAGARRAAFCRLEHVVPWVLTEARWEAGETPADAAAASPNRCAHCDSELTETLVLAVRHRGQHRIADAFCSVDHLRSWAAAGGRWQ